MRARQFEDLYFWQKAKELAKIVYRITGKNAFEADKNLREIFRQLCSCVMGEIAFGFAQGTTGDLKESLDISRGELMRMKSLSYLAQDLGFLMDDELEEIHAGILDVDRLMMGFIRGMRSTNRRNYSEPDGHTDDYDDSQYYSSSQEQEPEEALQYYSLDKDEQEDDSESMAGK